MFRVIVAGTRTLPLIAMPRSLPAWISGSGAPGSLQPNSRLPAEMSVNICGVLLYGTCASRMPVCWISHSVIRCADEPTPKPHPPKPDSAPNYASQQP